MDGGDFVHEKPMDLPPGFRFHPTNEELITHYLTKKAADADFSSRAIGEADLNKCEPWDLPSKAKMGEKEWYLFCKKDRKYPTGQRTNRATQTGYWKATGKDKEIYNTDNTTNDNYKCKILVGMKKTLVFYRGRAPKGEKSDWIMHEFRLDGKFSSQKYNQSNEWVICKVFKKSSGEKKLIAISSVATQDSSSVTLPVPPLRVSDTSMNSHVTCFSSDDVETMPSHTGTAVTEYNKWYNQCPPHLSLVHLLESNINMCPNPRENWNRMEQSSSKASQDTGITCDINPEISSVAKPSMSAQPFHLGQTFWPY